MSTSNQPRNVQIQANGLAHHLLEWAPISTSTSLPTVVLVHGFMDAATSWDRVAPTLAERGHRVLAPDMRGFGTGPRAPAGSYYHFADYVGDLAAVLAAVAPSEPLALVGHSMGGTITTLFAGAFPERVVRFANLEGLGPPDNGWEIAPVRMRRWIQQVATTPPREEPSLPTEEAFARLASSHPRVSQATLRERFAQLAEDVGVVDGVPRVRWRFDPLHRTTSPTPFFAKTFIEFAKRIACPVLFVSGGPTGFHVDDEEDRLAAFQRLTRETLEGAGHMLHWTRPTELAALLADFFAE